MNNRYMSNNIDRNATWRVGVYCRLSKDDELTGESASISNQRDILVNYCQSQGWQVVDVFQDDGYTGLNTDRPDLQRLLKACEKGLVNLVITKDQSRLGRNHVQTGFLMEEFFPKHGVRYPHYHIMRYTLLHASEKTLPSEILSVHGFVPVGSDLW